jgi:MFS family permease
VTEPTSPSSVRGLERAAGYAARVINDVAAQTSGTVIIGVVAAVLIAAAVGGLSLIGTLGTFGWIAYFIVLAVLALALGPVLAAGVSIRRHGSAKHRQLAAERLAAQRRKFSRELQAAERRRRDEAGAERDSNGRTVGP